MIGGGNRRDDGPFIRSNANGFAALDSLRRKKKSDKDKVSSKDAGKSKLKEVSEEKSQVFWAPVPLTVKSWADVDDEEDDDYYATTAPPQAIWGGSGLSKVNESEASDPVQETDSEDELLDDADDDVEDDHDQPEKVQGQTVEVPSVPKETERQLSKKERRKKELSDFEAMLADFGVNPKEKAEEESSENKVEGQHLLSDWNVSFCSLLDANKEMKERENGDAKTKGPALSESKASKKKKKKDKGPKEVNNLQTSPKCPEVPDGQEQEETAEAVQLVEDASSIDVKERLKKVLSKKKKSSKEMDAAARAASIEAAARSARLAAAKKKEKSHYNQQPTR